MPADSPPGGGFASSPFLRHLAGFLLGFAPLAWIDGVVVYGGSAGSRAAASLLLLGFGVVLAVLTRPLTRFAARLARRPGLAPEIGGLAFGLAFALAPQTLPAIPFRTIAGRLAWHPLFGPLAFLAVALVLAFLVVRLLGRLRARPLVLVTLAPLVAWAAVTVGWLRADAMAGPGTPPDPDPALVERLDERPNVIVVVLDTLRADAVTGSLGGLPLMPWLASYVSGGTWFRDGHAPANTTPASHATLFTGLDPHENGTLSKGFVTLAAGWDTLAEFLRRCGYRTLGVISNQRLEANLGFGQGYEVWDQSLVAPGGQHLGEALDRIAHSTLVRAFGGRFAMLGLGRIAKRFVGDPLQHRVTALDTAATVAAVLDRSSLQGEPLHLFVNYIDPHMPYEVEPEFAAEFPPPPSVPEFEAARHDMARTLELLEELQERILAGEDSAGLKRQLDWLHHAYFAQCRQLDAGLQRMFADLQRRGLLDDALVFVVADHGEHLGEHGWFGHGNTLHEELVRVPFYVVGPGFGPGVVRGAVGLVDVVPTVLRALGLELDAWGADLTGRPLQDPPDPERVLVLEAGALRGFLLGGWKFWAEDRGDRFEWRHLFDLENDPTESQDRLADAPAWARRVMDDPPIRPTREATARAQGVSNMDLGALGYADEAEEP